MNLSLKRLKYAGVAFGLVLQGCATAPPAPIYVDAAAPGSVPLHVEAPFVRSRTLYPDTWANLTVWDFTSDPKGKMLGIRKLRSGSKTVDTKLAVGRKLQLVMVTKDAFMGTIADCGAYVDLTPQSGHAYLLRFDFPEFGGWDKGCHISLLEKSRPTQAYALIREFTAPTRFTYINVH